MSFHEVGDSEYQCCGSMKIWSGSGSKFPDPDLDADAAIFVIDLQEASEKIIVENLISFLS
jgi:hypothetical protein